MRYSCRFDPPIEREEVEVDVNHIVIRHNDIVWSDVIIIDYNPIQDV